MTAAWAGGDCVKFASLVSMMATLVAACLVVQQDIPLLY